MLTRFLVVFRSPAVEGHTDVHFVDAKATSPLAATKMALKEAPPPFEDWAVVSTVPWPRGARSVDAAALRYGT